MWKFNRSKLCRLLIFFWNILLQPVQRGLEIVPNDQVLVCAAARERIQWHEKLQGSQAVQKRVHE